MKLTRTDREKLLAKIHALVQAKFYDPRFNGKDWNAIVEKHRASILDTDSTETFEKAVAQMLSELNSSGPGLLGPSTMQVLEALQLVRKVPGGSSRTFCRAVSPNVPKCALVML